MSTNIDIIQEVVSYIDDHLEERLDLDSLCRVSGYSKYHLSRIFSDVVGLSIHSYIKRRRLTEAARLLIFTDKKIMEIALIAGYETQQSFTVGFKTLFQCSPQAFRKKREFHPFQLKFTVDGKRVLKGDKIMEIRTVESGMIRLVGYRKSTRFGFSVIGQCWHKLHAKKDKIPDRKSFIQYFLFCCHTAPHFSLILISQLLYKLILISRQVKPKKLTKHHIKNF